MRLSDLIVKSKLNLEININQKHLEFHSSVYAKVNGVVLIEPVRVDGKVVNFESASVLIDLLYMREGKAPIIWKRVQLKSVSYNGKTYYKVIPTGDGFEINRRRSFRLNLGIKGVAQVGVNSVAYNIIVKDVSENGFSFLFQEEIDKPLRSTVRLVFSDEEITLSLNGLLVRTEKNGGNYLYGCMNTSSNYSLMKYINNKQKDILSKQNGILLTKNINSFPSKPIESNVKEDKTRVNTLQSNSKEKALNQIRKEERRSIFRKI